MAQGPGARLEAGAEIPLQPFLFVQLHLTPHSAIPHSGFPFILAASMERRLMTAFALAFFFVLLLRTAWLSDTAYYTLRTAENASRGLGFTWNPMERVQVFDHPLWMLALTAGHLVTGEAYGSALALSIVCSLLAAALVFAAATSECGLILAVIAIALSPSFLTFSTSGLEGPLLHLLIAAFTLVALDDRPGRSNDRRMRGARGASGDLHTCRRCSSRCRSWSRHFADRIGEIAGR